MDRNSSVRTPTPGSERGRCTVLVVQRLMIIDGYFFRQIGQICWTGGVRRKLHTDKLLCSLLLYGLSGFITNVELSPQVITSKGVPGFRKQGDGRRRLDWNNNGHLLFSVIGLVWLHYSIYH